MIVDIGSFRESLDAKGNPKPTFQPALEFDRKHGTHVGRRYRLPDGYDDTSLEGRVLGGMRKHLKSGYGYAGVEPFSEEEMVRTMQAVVAMNPELMGLQPAEPDMESAFHLLMGVTSGFNPRDIAYFIGVQNVRSDAEKIEYRRWLTSELGAYYMDDVQWVPSPDTVSDMIDQLGRRAVSESYVNLPPVEVGKDQLVWVYHWVTGTPVVAKIEEILTGQVVLNFDYEDSPLAGAPMCRVKRSSIIGPYTKKLTEGKSEGDGYNATWDGFVIVKDNGKKYKIQTASKEKTRVNVYTHGPKLLRLSVEPGLGKWHEYTPLPKDEDY